MSEGGFWRRLLHGVGRFLQRGDWPSFAGRDFAGRIMHTPVTDRFHAKQGRSTGRWVLHRETDGAKLIVYLKRHYQLPWWQRLLALLWPGKGWSPAFAEWQHLEWAKSAGIPVPEPVAAGEWIGPGLRLQSFLAIEELPGMTAVNELLPVARVRLSPVAFHQWKRAVLTEMARLTRILHAAKRYHKDLYLCHFYVGQASLLAASSLEDMGQARMLALRDVGPVHLIDLHRLGHHPWTGWRWRVKDLAQLLYSTELPGIDDRDRLCFFKRYLQLRKLDAAGRRLLRAVIWKANRYRRHNDERRAKSQELRAERPRIADPQDSKTRPAA